MIQLLRRRRFVRLFLVPMLSLCLASSQVRLPAQNRDFSAAEAAPQAGDRIMLMAQAFDSHIYLAWTPVEGAESYRLYRTPNNGGNLIASVAASHKQISSKSDMPQFDDRGVSNGTTYRYRVVPVVQAEEEGRFASNIVSATPQKDSHSNTLKDILEGIAITVLIDIIYNLWKPHPNLADDLLKNGPQVPSAFNMSDLTVVGFVHGGWLVTVDFELLQTGVVSIKVEEDGVASYTYLVDGAQTGRRQVSFFLPARFGRDAKLGAKPGKITIHAVPVGNASPGADELLVLHDLSCGARSVGPRPARRPAQQPSRFLNAAYMVAGYQGAKPARTVDAYKITNDITIVGDTLLRVGRGETISYHISVSPNYDWLSVALRRYDPPKGYQKCPGNPDSLYLSRDHFDTAEGYTKSPAWDGTIYGKAAPGYYRYLLIGWSDKKPDPWKIGLSAPQVQVEP